MLFVDFALIILCGVGLYSYVFRKKILSPVFWKYFLWINIVYSALYIIYTLAPNAPLINYLSYLQSIEQESSGWVEFTFSTLYTLPFLYAIYQLSKGKFRSAPKESKAVKKKKEVKKNNLARWGLFSGFLLFTEAAAFFLYGVILNYASLPDETFLVYLLIALIIPVVAIVFKLYRVSTNKLRISLLCAVLTFMGIMGLVITSPSQVQDPNVNVTKSELSEKELFESINTKRKQNGVKPLGYDKSTCALAKARVEEVNEKGIDIFGNSPSFQRTIDKIFQEDNSVNPDMSPDFYQEFLTYQETAEDAVDEWSQYETNVLFIDNEYQVGCIAEKDGFAVVVVGSFKDGNPAEDNTYFQIDTYPNGPVTSEVESI